METRCTALLERQRREIEMSEEPETNHLEEAKRSLCHGGGTWPREAGKLHVAIAHAEQLVLLNQLMDGVIRELGRIANGLAHRNR